jgi:hypothetical protein
LRLPGHAGLLNSNFFECYALHDMARKDVLANVAIIGAGVLTAYFASAWTGFIVALGIFLINLDAARFPKIPSGGLASWGRFLWPGRSKL